MTYVSMFPQLIAGPIVRFSTVNGELHYRTIDFRGFYQGSFRFLQGLIKKVLLANQMGALWNTLQEQPFGEISVLTSWLGAIAFTLQLYFDFSAYSDMAIGMGQMMGFHYLENFNYPLCAKSVTEFWRRWHISLSTWFRDYIYIPLGGNRKGIARQIGNIAVVWFLTGMWHGASWNFIFWGIYFFVFLILEKFFLSKYLKGGLLSYIYTFIIVIISFVIFSITDFSEIIIFLKGMFGINTNLINAQSVYYFKISLTILIISLFGMGTLIPNIINKMKKGGLNKVIEYLEVAFIIIILILSVACILSSTFTPFIYFRF